MAKKQLGWVTRARETAKRVKRQRQSAEEAARQITSAHYDRMNREAASKVIEGIRAKIEEAAELGERYVRVMYVDYDPDTGDPNVSESVMKLVEGHCKNELGLVTSWQFREQRHDPGHKLERACRELYVSL